MHAASTQTSTVVVTSGMDQIISIPFVPFSNRYGGYVTYGSPPVGSQVLWTAGSFWSQWIHGFLIKSNPKGLIRGGDLFAVPFRLRILKGQKGRIYSQWKAKIGAARKICQLKGMRHDGFLLIIAQNCNETSSHSGTKKSDRRCST